MGCPGRWSSAGQVSSIRAPPAVGVADHDAAAVGPDQPVDQVEAQAGAAAHAAGPELGEHPAAHLGSDALALVLDDDADPGELVARAHGRGTPTRTAPSPWRDAVLDQVGHDLGELVGVDEDLGQLVLGDVLDLAGGAGLDAVDDAARPGRGRRSGRGNSESRPVSIRATSSSSAISRLSRSESEWTVVSISFFWSSLSLSQRFSSAWTKPLTPGERRAQLVGHGGDQVGPLPVEPGPATAGAEQHRDPLDRTAAGGALHPGGDQHLGAVGQDPGLLGDRRRGCAGRRRGGSSSIPVAARAGRAARAPRPAACRWPRAWQASSPRCRRPG